MSSTRAIFAGLLLCALAGAVPPPLRAASGEEVIRLRAPAASPEPAPAPQAAPPTTPLVDVAGPRRGFDYNAFEARLESLWFQRKTLLADGRHQDAAEQSQLMRAFCAEESVRRVEGLASALLAEAARRLEQGDHAGALESLELAQSFDPGRPEVYLALARVYQRSGRGTLAAASQLLVGLRASVVRATRDLSLFNQLGLVLVVAGVGAIGLFALLMIVRYHAPFRHEVEERIAHAFGQRWAGAAGWALVLLPFMLPVVAGWAALYWILVTFRFMLRNEKLAALALLLVAGLAVPAYRMGVSAYGMTADPVVRTTLASAGGEYDPDRILKLRRLVHAHPDDAVYRFLLAGLYKNGRYLEDAFAEYKEALALDESFEQAHINLGNIFFATGQYSEAITSYNRAIEIDPDSVLAYFNRHLAQSEAFRFQEAEQTLAQARALDAAALTALFAAAGSSEERATPVDAAIEIRSLWEAALAGGGTETFYRTSMHSSALDPLLNPVSVLSLATLLGCLAAVALTGRRSPARRCIRCGRPFCHRCKSDRDTHEYCSQCLHLFVLGDGLSPQTKTRKLYEVERHERGMRLGRRIASVILPGAAQLLRGRALRGTLLILGWLAALVAWKPDLLSGLERALHLELALEELRRGGAAAGVGIHPLAVLGLAAVLVIWLVANSWLWRRREA